MAISFTNIWKDKVIDILVKFIRTEFKGAVSVYTGEEYEAQGNCSVRVFGVNQSLIRYDKSAFTNEYSIEIVYYLSGSNLNERAVDKMYRDISRLEQLLWNKTEPSDRGDDGGFYGGRVESITMNQKVGVETTVDNLLTARIDYVCNFSKV
tara:strand:- start:1103 stop:1555 length:453 start_codon:yes stop_codon:yes gene_type:complete